MKAFQEDLRNGMSIDSALRKHHLTFQEAFTKMKGWTAYNKKNKVKKPPRLLYIMRRGKRFVIRKKINKQYVLFGRYYTEEDAVVVRDALVEDGWNRDHLDRICRECNVKRVLPRTRKQLTIEYKDDLDLLYEERVKPLLDQGYSLTKVLRSLGYTNGRMYYELRECALNDGYEFKKAGRKPKQKEKGGMKDD